MILDDSPAFPATFLGAMRIGAVPVPVNPMDRVDNYVYYLDDSYASVLVVEASLLPALEAELESRLGLHVLVVDGDPGPHASFDVVAARSAGAGELPAADRHPPRGHGVLALQLRLDRAAEGRRPRARRHRRDRRSVRAEHPRDLRRRRVLFDDQAVPRLRPGERVDVPAVGRGVRGVGQGPIHPERIFDAVARYRPTLFFSVPALYAAMVKAPGADEVDFSCVRACVSAAEALPAAVLARWQALAGVPILDGIGSTEMLHIYCSNSLSDLAPGTSGRPVPGYELRLVDERGLDVPAGEAGDLMVRGDSCAAFYWHQRDKTRHCMRGEWFHTGDRYIVDADGHYVYQGRSDDMIKVGGLWVSPADVEGCLVKHPAVSEAAVIGVHVDDLSRIKAFVICATAPDDPDALADELRAWCKENLRRYEYPHVVEFVEDLPRTPTGKVQRYKLREAEQVRDTLAGARAIT